MTDKILQALVEEWKVQRALLDQFRLLGLKLPPVAAALASGLLVYGQGGKGYIGLAVALGTIMLLCWYAFVQLNIHCSGIRCVELELRINKKLRVSNAEGMNWTIRILNEYIDAPGFIWYLVVSSILGALLFIAAMAQGLAWLYVQIGPWGTSASTLAILAMVASVSLGMCRVQRFYRSKKRDLVESLSQPEANGEELPDNCEQAFEPNDDESSASG